MFAYISGKIAHKGIDFLIVDNAGIGYKVKTSGATLSRLGAVNEDVKVYTHYHVREDDISLFGFATNEELSMFELLITVSGVGPKVALSILSSISPSAFGLAIITSDAKSMTKAQGVGIKLAQRIILELKDKLEKDQKNQLDGFNIADLEVDSMHIGIFAEAASALVVLGYNQFEANKAIGLIYDENMELEALIMAALKSIYK